MDDSRDIAEVREAHRIDPRALERYLARHLAGFRGPLRVRQFEGGQSNPTYLVEDGGRRYVLRRKPPGKLLPSAHAVEREYRVIRALADSGVPVPGALALCEEPGVLGTPFFVMEYVPGRVFREPHLAGVSPAFRRAVFEDMARVLAALHTVDYEAVGLGTFGRPGNYFQRQIDRWSGIYRASQTVRIEAMERLLEWLPANIPPDDTTTIVHGDYRLGNMIVHPTEPRIVAVLDWELSTLGHPLADLAYTCLPYHTPHEQLDGYLGLDVASAGYPTEAALLDDYCRRTGRDGIDGWPFYVAFALFRLAAISQGIAGRVRDGTAAGADAERRGALAPLRAELAWEMLAPLAR